MFETPISFLATQKMIKKKRGMVLYSLGAQFDAIQGVGRNLTENKGHIEGGD
jgi:hypothetical protein